MQQVSSPLRRVVGASVTVLSLLLLAAVAPAFFDEVGYAYEESSLAEMECAEVGANLVIVSDVTALSDAYVAPGEAYFPDTPPGEDPDNFISVTTRGEPVFRIRQDDPGPVRLWLREQGGEWKLFTLTSSVSDGRQEDGWSWWPDYQGYTQTAAIGPGGMDVAFYSSDQQLDQVYSEDEFSFEKIFPRPFFRGLEGNNCPDFSNLPPVADIRITSYGGDELYEGELRDLNASDSYDPDGILTRYEYSPGTTVIGYDNEPFAYEAAFNIPGDTEATVSISDYYGASDAASVPVRVIPVVEWSDRTVYVAQGDCMQDQTSSGPTQTIYLTIPDVSASDAGEYHMAGVFNAGAGVSDCIEVSVNGGDWASWDVYNPAHSYFPGSPFTLQAGDNTVEVKVCDGVPTVDRLIISPDTDFPGVLSHHDAPQNSPIVDLDCSETGSSTAFWLEAECAAYGDRWELGNDPAASRGGFVVVGGANALAAPPADDPANYVRFTVADARAGDYYLQARIEAPTNLDDSYYVRVNGSGWTAWKSGMQQGVGFHWNLLPGGPLRLEEGDNTVDFAYREDGTRLDKIYLAPSPAPVNGPGAEDPNCSGGVLQPIALWMEAECAPYGRAWTPHADATAGGGAYLVALSGNSTKAPPPAVPENLVTFEVEVPDHGRGQQLFIYGRVAAAAPDDDSFWVRINGGEWYAWNSLKHGPGLFQWNLLPFRLPATPSARHTIEFAFRESGTWLDGIYVTSTDELPTAPPAADPACGSPEPRPVAFEAECGIPGGDWSVMAIGMPVGHNLHARYEGDRQLTEPTGRMPEQELHFDFTIEKVGVYHLFLRMDAPDVSRNSVWIQLDDGPWVKMWEEIGGAQLLTSGFEWRKVNDDGTDVAFELDPGPHTLYIANREPGTDIDQVYLSLDPGGPTDFIPGTDGILAGTENCARIFFPDARQLVGRPVAVDQFPDQLSLYPNPVLDELTLELTGDYSGPVLGQVYDGAGRQLLTLQYNKERGLLRERVSVSDLPPGVYRLRIVIGDRQVVKTFLRL